jgi:hypothetical protein
MKLLAKLIGTCLLVAAIIVSSYIAFLLWIFPSPVVDDDYLSYRASGRKGAFEYPMVAEFIPIKAET